MVNEPPSCFGKGEPDVGFHCSTCEYGNPCASFSKKFVEIKNLVVKAKKVIRADKDE